MNILYILLCLLEVGYSTPQLLKMFINITPAVKSANSHSCTESAKIFLLTVNTRIMYYPIHPLTVGQETHLPNFLFSRKQ